MSNLLEELYERDPRAQAHGALAMMSFRLFRCALKEPERAAFWALEFIEFRERVLSRQSVLPAAIDAVANILNGNEHPEILGFPEPIWVTNALRNAHRAAKAEPQKSGVAFGYQAKGRGRRVPVEGIREELERIEIVLDVASRRANGASFEVACEEVADAIGRDPRTVSRHIKEADIRTRRTAIGEVAPDGVRILTDEEEQDHWNILAKLLAGPPPADG